MGSTYKPGVTLKGLLQECRQPYSSTLIRANRTTVARTQITTAACFRGNPRYKGVIWYVRETWATLPGHNWLFIKKLDAFIVCRAVQAYRDKEYGSGWMCKDMEENMHPYYYSCPIKYLELTKDYYPCEPWREGVRQYHEERRARQRDRKSRRCRYTPSITGIGFP